MPNLVVSSDVDAMLQSANKAAILSNIGAGSSTQVATNTSNIATNSASISNLQDGQQQNGEAIATKAPTVSPVFTGGADFNGGANFHDTVDFEEGANVEFNDESVFNKNISLNDGANLHVRSDTATNIDAGSSTTGLFKIGNDWVQNGHTIKAGDELAAAFDSVERLLYDISGNEVINFTTADNLKLNADVTIGVNSTNNIDVKGQATFHTNVNFDSGASFEAGTVEFQGSPVVFHEDIQAKNIKCFGTATNTAQPITFSSNEHRFKDYDGSPDDLMVIEKVDGFTGARIGINRDKEDSPSNSLQAALHVVAGRNVNDADDFDLGLRVDQGGAFFDKYIRIGDYTDDERNDIDDVFLGQVIYNSDQNEFQAYMKDGSGGREWKAFQMTSIST